MAPTALAPPTLYTMNARLPFSALLPLALATSALAPLPGQAAPAVKTAQAPARTAAPAATSRTYADRAEAMLFADDVAARRDLDAAWVREAIGQARFLPRVPGLMLPPAKGQAKNWQAYRSRFVEPIRIRAGLRFWQTHAATLARAEREYGVPAEIIMGILGVETLYGQHMGNFRVMDALATLAFDFPSAHPRAAERQAFFQRELEQFLSLSARTQQDPFALRGSYAGAMGMPQFMPTSWARWAVDFDGDGRIDLFGSPADAIGSVANYFVAHGWQSGMPTHYPVLVQAEGQALDTLLAPDILPSFTATRMAELGVQVLGSGAQHQGPLALVELENGTNAAPSYVAGTENFYAVTRYNWSSYYALAVIELGQEIAAQRTARSAAGER